MRFVVTFTMAVAVICTASVQLATPATQGIQLIRNTDTAARVTQKCQRAKELKVTKNPRNYAKPHSLGYRRKAHKRWHDRRRACQSYTGNQIRRLVDGCLHQLIIKEASGFRLYDPSTWYPAARVPNSAGSGAYGIPQALPGSKMSSHGADWAWNPLTQIRWMVDYVQKYGGSCAALSFHNANGWY